MKKSENSRQRRQTAQDTNTPPSAGYTVLAAYLSGWAPVEAREPGVILRTSQEIIDDLSDMCDISVNDVSEVMAFLGFRACFEPFGPRGWMMRPKPGASYFSGPDGVFPS